MSDFEPPPFPRGRIKIRRVHPSADGTIEQSTVAATNEWWDAVLRDPLARGKPLDFDTLWFNRSDTADITCKTCAMSRSLAVTEMLVQSANRDDTKVGEAIVNLIGCKRKAKDCGLGYTLRNRRR